MKSGGPDLFGVGCYRFHYKRLHNFFGVDISDNDLHKNVWPARLIEMVHFTITLQRRYAIDSNSHTSLKMDITNLSHLLSNIISNEYVLTCAVITVL